ncbi:MAG: riboflavin synthase [candidate division WOR-3 bacterium]|nr:MAG: riboflavin synthase [candidate division WOR-3 bacterium]
MFTGIIEEKGRIKSISRSRIQKISIESELQVNKGDSIAVQGICLTITDATKNGFTVDAMSQTLGATTLKTWRGGDYVNLERALRIGDRLGGHIMLGHVDDVGKLIKIKSNEYFFQIEQGYSAYIVPKGSIGIDGASLTVSSIRNNIVSVSLIPYTLKHTALGSLRIGAEVNIEYDYLAKFLKRK